MRKLSTRPAASKTESPKTSFWRRSLSELGKRTERPAISWLMQMTLENPQLISLAAGFTDNSTLPAREAKKLLSEILGERASSDRALQYGSTVGDAALRALTAARLVSLDADAAGRPSKLDRAAYAKERVLITNGSQQLLYLVSEALCSPGDIVLVEDPTYFVFLGIAQSHGLRCRGVRTEQDGIDLAHLEEVLEELKKSGQLPRLKFLYLVSYHQNPTGITTAFSKKANALSLLKKYESAAGHPLFLVEDAAYRELLFEGKGTPSALLAPRARERVVYTSTFSKPFATGVRVGFGLIPEPLFELMARLKGNHDFGTASLLQSLLSRALQSGAYDRHLAKLRQRYAAKAERMQAGLLRGMSRLLSWQKPQGGLYFWASVKKGTSTSTSAALFRHAVERGVLYVPGELCYAPDPVRAPPRNQMRLSFGNASEGEISEGLSRLAQALSGR